MGRLKEKIKERFLENMVGALNKKHAYTLKTLALAGAFNFNHTHKPTDQPPITSTIGCHLLLALSAITGVFIEDHVT